MVDPHDKGQGQVQYTSKGYRINRKDLRRMRQLQLLALWYHVGLVIIRLRAEPAFEILDLMRDL